MNRGTEIQRRRRIEIQRRDRDVIRKKRALRKRHKAGPAWLRELYPDIHHRPPLWPTGRPKRKGPLKRP